MERKIITNGRRYPKTYYIKSKTEKWKSTTQKTLVKTMKPERAIITIPLSEEEEEEKEEHFDSISTRPLDQNHNFSLNMYTSITMRLVRFRSNPFVSWKSDTEALFKCSNKPAIRQDGSHTFNKSCK